MKNELGIVLGTFLPFHKGHEMLIKFAHEYMKQTEYRNINETCVDNILIIILSSRSQEPIRGCIREKALNNFIYKTRELSRVAVYHHYDDNAPQNPSGDDDVEFWNYWKNVIKDALMQCVGETNPLESFSNKFVFSSENYGAKVAEIIEGKSVNFDKERFTLGVSGTKIRNNPISNSHLINNELRNLVRTDYVMFGSESIGKTTMTKRLGETFPSLALQEYARPYLMEQDDKSPSLYNMQQIFVGQSAYEKSALSTDIGQLVNFLDTDIMSTVGYARLIGMDKSYEKKFSIVPPTNRQYLVLAQDEVPYEYDILRYGNGIRESDDEFWINLLEEYGLPYTVISGSTFDIRYSKIVDIVNKNIKNKFNFVRE